MRHHSTRPLRWRALGLALIGIALALLSACGASASNTPSYHTGAGQIVAQLFPQPGNILLGLLAVPTWTLYGDGTVIYSGGPIGGPIGGSSSQLMSGKLSQSEVNRLLDVVVNQDHFFASTKAQYGHLIPDTGDSRLTVNADGKSKSVTLFGDPGSSADQETKNVFAVENTLLGEHPANAAVYAAPGAALLVSNRTPASQGSGTAWPFSDIDLAQAYSVSCGVTEQSNDCPSSGPGAKLFGVYGAHTHDVLTLVGGSGFQAQQGQYVYSVLAFPLLPDALVAQNGQAPGVLINGTGRIGLQPAPPGK